MSSYPSPTNGLSQAAVDAIEALARASIQEADQGRDVSGIHDLIEKIIQEDLGRS